MNFRRCAKCSHTPRAGSRTCVIHQHEEAEVQRRIADYYRRQAHIPHVDKALWDRIASAARRAEPEA